MERLTSSIGYCDAFCENSKNRCQIYTSCINRQTYEKLKEYEDLEEQGKLLKLPCKVGDKIYYPNKFGNRVVEFEIIQIQIFKDETVFFDDSDNEYHAEDFGKTVYLTREQAENKLNETEDNDG